MTRYEQIIKEEGERAVRQSIEVEAREMAKYLHERGCVDGGRSVEEVADLIRTRILNQCGLKSEVSP